MSQVAVSGDTQNDAIRPFTAIVAQLELAWNRGEPAVFAACFGDQTDFIDMFGGHGVGRQAVGQAHWAMWQGPFAQSRIEYRIDKIKPIGQRAAVVFLRSKLTTSAGQVIWGRPTLTMRFAEDGWRIAVFQNTRISEMVVQQAQPQPAAPDQSVSQSASQVPAEATPDSSDEPAPAAEAPGESSGSVGQDAKAPEAPAKPSAPDSKSSGSGSGSGSGGKGRRGKR